MAPVGNAAQVRYMSERQDAGYQPLRGRVRAAALFPRPIWGSERAFVLASVAGVVGLGNLWRFPYMAGENGGGSFLAAYLICVLIIAIPLAIIESTAGSVVQRTPVDLFRRIAGRPGAWFGWLPAIVTAAIMSYYFVITGWTLGYAVQSLGGTYQTFVDFTDSMVPLLYFFIVAVLVLLLLIRGVAAIERASLVLLPVLVVVVVGLAIYAQTTEGAGEAAQFYFRFESDRLFSPGTWQKAAGQSFYSLGVGQGILIVYGSFVPAGTNTIRSTAIIAITNSGVSIVAGLLVFPIVFTFGISPDAGSQLSFTAFPRVFETVEGGRYLGMLFFWLLFVAGFTSCLSGALVVSAVVRDEFRMGARRAALLVVGLITLAGIPSALSFTGVGLNIGGEPLLDVVDRFTGSGVMVAAGLFGAILLAWRMPTGRMLGGMHGRRGVLARVGITPRLILYLARGIPVAIVAWLILAFLA